MSIRIWMSLLVAMTMFVPIAHGKEIKPWQAEVELGVVITSGNTDTKNMNGKAKVINERQKWRHTGRLEGYGSENGGVSTAERYFASAKSNYKLNDRSYVYGLIDYEADRFSGFNYRANANLGYGYTVIKKEDLTLDLEAGAGVRQSEVEATGESLEEGVVRGAGDLEWKISDTTSFTEELSVEVGEDSTFTKSVTALKSQIAGNLATKISYTVKNNSEVPVGAKETDIETAITLVYSF